MVLVDHYYQRPELRSNELLFNERDFQVKPVSMSICFSLFNLTNFIPLYKSATLVSGFLLFVEIFGIWYWPPMSNLLLHPSQVWWQKKQLSNWACLLATNRTSSLPTCSFPIESVYLITNYINKKKIVFKCL